MIEESLNPQMHPPLFRPHPQCQKEIANLIKCHKDFPYKKFIGECNDVKVTLDRCLKAEKEVKRKANADDGRRMIEKRGGKKFDPEAEAAEEA